MTTFFNEPKEGITPEEVTEGTHQLQLYKKTLYQAKTVKPSDANQKAFDIIENLEKKIAETISPNLSEKITKTISPK